jgi:hypothetical protein
VAEEQGTGARDEGWRSVGSVRAGPTEVQVGVDRIGHVTLGTKIFAKGLGASAAAAGALPPARARELRGLLDQALDGGAA